MSTAVIYTDLDGTLLDHHTYSFEAAGPALAMLKKSGIPVIPCTSKTRSETTHLMQALDLDGPMIIENGAAIWVPQDWGLVRPENALDDAGAWCHRFGPPRSLIRRQLATFGIEWSNRYQCLSDLTDKQVAAVTGLDLANAARAKERQYCETLVWLGTPSDRRAFAKEVESMDMQCVQGGRFVHVLASGGKAQAVSWLHRKIRAERPEYAAAVSVAAGDAENDVAMLEITDLALLVRSPVNELPTLERCSGVVVSEAMGPAGWAEGIEALILRAEQESDHERLLSKRLDNHAA
ncbi:HAD-IIB family hydrolase [Luminiphilus sp.]|jgi:mannosyl-3-phosphoglycerate phosphatase|nr:HAD-IIB family hydrolase [Luminiphilus sp.]